MVPLITNAVYIKEQKVDIPWLRFGRCIEQKRWDATIQCARLWPRTKCREIGRHLGKRRDWKGSSTCFAG